MGETADLNFIPNNFIPNNIKITTPRYGACDSEHVSIAGRDSFEKLILANCCTLIEKIRIFAKMFPVVQAGGIGHIESVSCFIL